MELQILHAFPIQSQPRLDVCVLGVARSGIRVSLLDFAGAIPLDLRQHRTKRHAKNGALRSAPVQRVGQRLSQFGELPTQFHWIVRSTEGEAMRLTTKA